MTTRPKAKPSTARSRKPSQLDPNQVELDEWAERIYTATLPSGREVDFRLPTLGEMAAMGELPVELQQLAVAEWAEPGISAHLAAAPFRSLTEESSEEDEAAALEVSQRIANRIGALNRFVVAAALVRPAATPEQLERMPYRDLEMLSALINRGTGVDALGRHVGVVPLDTFRLVAHAHGSECDGAPACQACETAGRLLAQVQR